MKLTHAFLALLLLVCYAACAGDTNEVGRYQLFSGPKDEADDAGRIRTGTALYRIDTVTGQTWLYNRWLIRGPKKPDGQFAEGWIELGEDFQVSSYIATGIAHGWPQAGAAFTNNWGTTNGFREAMDRMYWSPKRRDEFDAIIADAKLQSFLATNRPAEIRKPQ